MANNELVRNDLVALQCPDVELAKEQIMEDAPIMEEIETYLQGRGILNEEEKILENGLKEASELKHRFIMEYQSPDFDVGILREQSERLLELYHESHMKLVVIRDTIRNMKRERILDVCGALSEAALAIQEIVPEVIKDLNAPDERNNFSTIPQEQQLRLESWSMMTGVMHSLITEAYFKVAQDPMSMECVLKVVDRFRRINVPKWWFDLVKSVSKGMEEDMTDFREDLSSYQNDLGDCVVDCQQEAGYY